LFLPIVYEKRRKENELRQISYAPKELPTRSETKSIEGKGELRKLNAGLSPKGDAHGTSSTAGRSCACICFVACERDSSYVTGEVLTLLGGETTAA